MRLLIASLVFILAAPLLPAAAPAGEPDRLDCRHTRTTIEATICGDRGLLALHHSVMDAYRSLAAIDGPHNRLLDLQQRVWLRQRTRFCEGGPPFRPCLRENYEARADDLRRLSSLLTTADSADIMAFMNRLQEDLRERAFLLIDSAPGIAEEVFRGSDTLQARVGLAMVLRLGSRAPQANAEEIAKLLAEIAAAPDGQKLPSSPPADRYDGTVAGLVPFMRTAAGFIYVSCRLLERFPPLIAAFQPEFGSSLDIHLPDAECDPRAYPLPASVDEFDRAISPHNGGQRLPCNGTMHFGSVVAFNASRLRTQVLPRSLAREVPDKPPPHHWTTLTEFPLRRWSYAGPWNRREYAGLRGMFIRTRGDLATYYRQRFGLTARDAAKAAHIGLWLGYREWAWDKREPEQLAAAVMDAGAKPSLAELLRRDTPLATKPEPVLSLAIARPAAVAPLLAAHAEPNAVNPFGKTPLMTAAQFDATDAILQLLQAGARVNAQSLAPDAIPDNEPEEEKPLGSGCEVYAIASGSRTALMYAAANASLPTIRALLAAGADTSIRDGKGHTAFDYLLGNGPVPRNPRLTGDELDLARQILTPRRSGPAQPE